MKNHIELTCIGREIPTIYCPFKIAVFYANGKNEMCFMVYGESFVVCDSRSDICRKIEESERDAKDCLNRCTL